MLNSVKGTSPISQNDPAASASQNKAPAPQKSDAGQDKVTLSSQLKQTPKPSSTDEDHDGDNY